MANVKLKSIFTKEDIYTVLQLLKALADGVDENDTNMQAQIDELKQKIATLKPEPEGYSVDNAGNVTIAGALKANNNGDVEVSKNIDVNGNATFFGKNSFIWHGVITETIEGLTATSDVSGFFFHGPNITVNGQLMGDPGILALTGIKSDDGIDFYIINPKYYDPATNEIRPATVEEILSGNWSIYMSVESADVLIKNRGDATLKELNVNRIMGSEADPVIDRFFKVQDEGIVLGEVAQKAKLASQAKYQHTVTLHGDGFEFCFTAMSPKNMLVSSYIDLRTVFGGRRIGLTGFSAALSARPVYIDLNGGTVASDFIRVYNEAGGGFSNKTLSSIGTIIYEDDVCEPK